MLADMLLLSRPACKEEGEGGVCSKDCIAKVGGTEKGAEAFEVSNATAVRGGWWGGQTNCQPSGSW
jgi:hypothetical protein